MKMLTASTLALTLAGTTAFAEAHMTDPAKVDSMQMNEMKGDLIRSRDITGGVVFTVNDPDGEWHSNTAYNAVDEGWNEIGEIEDIMGAVVYLASDAAAMVTGTSLIIDGGWTAW
mgnify:CR=1 FL=1